MRSIDADTLKADLRQYFTDGVLDGISARLAFNQILHDIDNAPTIDDLSEYSDKLWQKAYERGKAEAITNEDIKFTGEDIKFAIDESFKLGYEMAKAKFERPQEVNCSHCDYFKFSKSLIENVVKVMTDYNIESIEDLMKELNHINEWLGGENNES